MSRGVYPLCDLLHELWDLLTFTNRVNVSEIPVKFYSLSCMAFPELYIIIAFKKYFNACKVCPTHKSCIYLCQ